MHWVTTVSKFSLLYCFVIFITDHDPAKKPPLTNVTAFMPSGGLQQFTIMFIFIFILHIAFVLFSFFPMNIFYFILLLMNRLCVGCGGCLGVLGQLVRQLTALSSHDC